MNDQEFSEMQAKDFCRFFGTEFDGATQARMERTVAALILLGVRRGQMGRKELRGGGKWPSERNGRDATGDYWKVLSIPGAGRQEVHVCTSDSRGSGSKVLQAFLPDGARELAFAILDVADEIDAYESKFVREAEVSE